MAKTPKLEAYLKKKKLSVNKFALMIPTSPQNIHNLINGRDVILSIAYKIEIATDGEVTCKDLCEDYVLPHLK